MKHILLTYNDISLVLDVSSLKPIYYVRSQDNVLKFYSRIKAEKYIVDAIANAIPEDRKYIFMIKLHDALEKLANGIISAPAL